METPPILIVRVPFEKTEDDVANIFLDFEESPVRDDYHILVLKDYNPGRKEIEFECVNSNATEIEFEELKLQLLKSMEAAQLKNRT